MQPLMEMGFDSLSVMELRTALEAKFSLTLPATLSFDHPTASAIAHYIEGELCDASHIPLQDTWQRSPRVPERTSIEEIQVALIDMVKSMIGINITLEQVSIYAQPIDLLEPTKTYICPQSGYITAVKSCECMFTKQRHVICHTVEYELLVQPLMETGLDSLGVVEIQDMIASHFAINIPTTFSFDYPTLASMAIQIASLLQSTPAVDKIDPQESLTYLGNQRHNNGNQSGVIGVGCRYPKGTHYCDNIFVFTRMYMATHQFINEFNCVQKRMLPTPMSCLCLLKDLDFAAFVKARALFTHN